MAELVLPETTITTGNGTIAGSVALRSYNTSRQNIFIQNLGTGVLYIGGSGVSTVTGIQIVSGGHVALDRSRGAAVYCTTDGTCDVRFLEEIV